MGNFLLWRNEMASSEGVSDTILDIWDGCVLENTV